MYVTEAMQAFCPCRQQLCFKGRSTCGFQISYLRTYLNIVRELTVYKHFVTQTCSHKNGANIQVNIFVNLKHILFVSDPIIVKVGC